MTEALTTENILTFVNNYNQYKYGLDDEIKSETSNENEDLWWKFIISKISKIDTKI